MKKLTPVLKIPLITIFVGFVLLSSCHSEDWNGFYCATIKSYNPTTNHKSSYTLKILISNKHLKEIQFPNGGHLDEEDFGLVEVNSENFSFRDNRNKAYNCKIVGKGNDCSPYFERLAVRCKGTTKSGRRCKNMTDNESGYCYVHE
jgi:hypothetical protein